MKSETVNLNPNLDPQLTAQLPMEVGPETVQRFDQTFGDMVDKYGKMYTFVGAEGSFHGRSYSSQDKDGNLFEVSRNAETGELKVYSTTQEEDGEKTEIYRLNGNQLTYEDISKNMLVPRTFEETDDKPNPQGVQEIRADRIPPSKEVQESMVNGFVDKNVAFERSQRRPINTLRRIGRFVLRKNDLDAALYRHRGHEESWTMEDLDHSDEEEKPAEIQSEPVSVNPEAEAKVTSEKETPIITQSAEKEVDPEEIKAKVASAQQVFASFNRDPAGRATIDKIFSILGAPDSLIAAKQQDEKQNAKKTNWSEYLSKKGNEGQLESLLTYYAKQSKALSQRK